MKRFRIGGRIVLFPLHRRQDEFILIAHQREGILSACHEALEPEEPLEEQGEAAHIGSSEIEMFKLHWHRPFMLEGTGADEADDAGRAESKVSTNRRHRDNLWELAGLTKPAMSFSAFEI
jgi:hypothetical protein